MFLKDLEEHPLTELRAGKVKGISADKYVKQQISNMRNNDEKAVRERLRRLSLDDVESVVRMALRGRERVYATPSDEGGTAMVLWLDPEHHVWRSDR